MRPLIPFVAFPNCSTVDWALDKGLCLFHPAIDTYTLWHYLLSLCDDPTRIRRVLDALERDTSKYGLTLGAIVASTHSTIYDVDETIPGDHRSIYDAAFIDNPQLFIALCERARSPFRLQNTYASSCATCYYAADMCGVEWTTHPVPCTRQCTLYSVH
jgi:hypothetical protein